MPYAALQSMVTDPSITSHEELRVSTSKSAPSSLKCNGMDLDYYAKMQVSVQAGKG
jgi:hypothetical protein